MLLILLWSRMPGIQTCINKPVVVDHFQSGLVEENYSCVQWQYYNQWCCEGYCVVMNFCQAQDLGSITNHMVKGKYHPAQSELIFFFRWRNLGKDEARVTLLNIIILRLYVIGIYVLDPDQILCIQYQESFSLFQFVAVYFLVIFVSFVRMNILPQGQQGWNLGPLG